MVFAIGFGRHRGGSWGARHQRSVRSRGGLVRSRPGWMPRLAEWNAEPRLEEKVLAPIAEAVATDPGFGDLDDELTALFGAEPRLPIVAPRLEPGVAVDVDFEILALELMMFFEKQRAADAEPASPIAEAPATADRDFDAVVEEMVADFSTPVVQPPAIAEPPSPGRF